MTRPRTSPLVARPTPRQSDWAVTGAALAASAAGLTYVALSGNPLSVPPAVALVPFATLPLLWRRTHAGIVLAILAATFITSLRVRSALPDGMGLAFGGYAAALYGSRPVRHLGGVMAVFVLATAFGALLAEGTARLGDHLILFAFGYGVAWVLGDRTRLQRAYLAELTDRTRRLEQQRDEHARRAAEEERGRIARELHDVVAHDVSVIAV